MRTITLPEKKVSGIESLDVGATMGHEIRYQKAGSGLIPLLEGADRNLLLQQRSRSCGGEVALTQFALRTLEAIRCRSAHGKQLASALLWKRESCDLFAEATSNFLLAS
ncbi:MAG TPA: hypothetical protein VFZ02_12725 [Ktedonobacteraceae bacterium]